MVDSGTESDAPRRVAVIGAGAAGLMAAETLAEAGVSVTVFERMPAPARKFLLAGRGGLNLTHSAPLDKFLDAYGEGDGADYARGAVAAFTPADCIAWTNTLGQPTLVGSSGRVFPKAMKASPLLRAWLSRLGGLGVTLRLRHTWTGFDATGQPIINGPSATRIPDKFDAVVLALGGASWPRLGSDGAWLPVLSASGVEVTPFVPSNCGIVVSWSAIFAERFAGQPLKRISVGIGQHTYRGEAMITRGGLEGGAIYAAGRDIRRALSAGGSAVLHVDLKPDLSIEQLTDRLARPRGKQSLATHIRKSTALDPPAIGLLREAGLPADAGAIACLIKSVPVQAEGLAGLDRAISTAGGVSAAAVDGNGMLKALPGVFVAGEMLDWDAPTGGYLLQASFATGVYAAQGIVRWLVKRAAEATA